MHLTRRAILQASVSAPFISGAFDPVHAASSAAWQEISPKEAGFVADIGQRVDAAFKAGELSGLHGLIVARGGKLVLERYYPGQDENWGRNLGVVNFGADTLHDLRSASKSIVALLYGVALSEGKVPTLDTPILNSFPEYADLNADPKRKAISIEHVLSMTMGTDWNEDLPYTSSANSEIAMEQAKDRYRFILERAIVVEPGKRWIYSGGATALLGKIIAKGTGMRLQDYAREKLFGPLGITQVEWILASDGEVASASGLRMRPRDLAKIGQLILDKGLADGKAVVPANWLEASFQPRAMISTERGDYGYHWYLGKLRASGKQWVGAFGNGGQRLIIIPALELIIAITAGNYNREDQWKMPVEILGKYVLGALA